MRFQQFSESGIANHDADAVRQCVPSGMACVAGPGRNHALYRVIPGEDIYHEQQGFPLRQ